MSNLRISLIDHGTDQGGTYACDRATPDTAGPDNLADPQRSRILQTSASHTSMTLDVTWAAAANVGIAGVFGLPDILGASVTVSTYNGSAWASADTCTWTAGVPSDSNFSRMLSGRCEILWHPAAAVSVKGVRFAISVSSAITWTASRLWAGDYWAPETNVDYGLSLGLIDTSVHVRSASGSLRTRPGALYRRLSLPLSWLTATDLSTLATAARAGGCGWKTKDRLISLLPAEGSGREPEAHMIGRFANDLDLSLRVGDYWIGRLDIEEL